MFSVLNFLYSVQVVQTNQNLSRVIPERINNGKRFVTNCSKGANHQVSCTCYLRILAINVIVKHSNSIILGIPSNGVPE